MSDIKRAMESIESRIGPIVMTFAIPLVVFEAIYEGHSENKFTALSSRHLNDLERRLQIIPYYGGGLNQDMEFVVSVCLEGLIDYELKPDNWNEMFKLVKKKEELEK